MSRFGRQQTPYPFDECGRCIASGQACPLHRPERVRDKGFLIARPINDDGHQKRLLLGHMVCTFDGELPLVPKVALKPLLDPMLEDLAGEIAARGLTVTLDLSIAEIMSERQGLQEALANLLSNAVKFSPPQGGTLAVRSYREGDQAVVAVADRGVGVDMKYHDRIFGIFERLHRQEDYPGTGVGLAIVRKVAERHGGRAWAESVPGQGSTFFLAFPDPR